MDFGWGRFEITWDLYNLFVTRDIRCKPNYLKAANSEVQLDVDAVSGATTPYVEMSFGMGIDGLPSNLYDSTSGG
jgi:hypothetical protein